MALFHKSGTLKKYGPVEKPLLHASYQLTFLYAKKNKPHTIAEELVKVKPCAMEMAKAVLATEAEKN